MTWSYLKNKVTWRIGLEEFWKASKVFGNALRIWQKYTCRRVVFFRNFTGCNNVSEASSHFKKMTYSLRQDLHSYSAICIFCVTRYIGFDKQSLGSVLKVLAKSLKNVFDELHFIVNLHSFLLLPVPLGKLLFM